MSEPREYSKVIIYGDIPSKANQYQIIKLDGHSSLRKSDAVKRYETQFYLQNPLRNINISTWFEIEVKVFFSSNRKDLDGAFKLLLDVLQSSGTIKNDRYCTKIVAEKFVDKKSPRVEFVLRTVNV